MKHKHKQTNLSNNQKEPSIITPEKERPSPTITLEKEPTASLEKEYASILEKESTIPLEKEYLPISSTIIAPLEKESSTFYKKQPLKIRDRI